VALGRAEILLLPRWLVELIFPVTTLPFESALISILLETNPRLGKLVGNGIQSDIFTQQIFALSFLSFFAVLLILTVQALADALCSGAYQQTISGILKALLMLELIRVFTIYILLVDRGSLIVTLPTNRIVLEFLFATAPLALIFSTSFAGVGIWLLLAAGYRYIASVWGRL